MGDEPANGTDARSPDGTEPPPAVPGHGTESADPQARYQRSAVPRVPRMQGAEHRIRLMTVDVARLLIALDTYIPEIGSYDETTVDERNDHHRKWHPWRELRSKLAYGPGRFTMDGRFRGHPNLDELTDQECDVTGRVRPTPRW